MSNLTLSILIIILFVIIFTILVYDKHTNKILNLCKKIVDDDRSIIEHNAELLDFIHNDLTFIRQYMIRRKYPIIKD